MVVPVKWKSHDELPLKTVAVVARIPWIATSPPILVMIMLPRGVVNIEPPGPTVTVPMEAEKHVAPGQTTEGSIDNGPVTMPTVFVLPVIETVSVPPFVNEPRMVPFEKVPVGKSKLLASAAVGKARANSASSIIRLMLNPPEKTVGPSQCQSQGSAYFVEKKAEDHCRRASPHRLRSFSTKYANRLHDGLECQK